MVWKDGVIVTLPTFGGIGAAAMGINDNGDVVGYALMPNRSTHAFLWHWGAASLIDLGGTSQYSQARSINNAGQVAGFAALGAGQHAVVWSNSGAMTDLGTDGSTDSMAWRIDEEGEVAGTMGSTGVIWFAPAAPADITPPVITYTGNVGTYTVDQTVDITCTATDDGSGVASTTCQNIYGDAYTFGLGPHEFTATAVDNAGNSASAGVVFNVVVTPASLCTLTARWSTKPGVTQSLCAKLDAYASAVARGDASATHIRDAYVNEVRAQSSTAFSTQQAAVLASLAGGLGG